MIKSTNIKTNINIYEDMKNSRRNSCNDINVPLHIDTSVLSTSKSVSGPLSDSFTSSGFYGSPGKGTTKNHYNNMKNNYYSYKIDNEYDLTQQWSTPLLARNARLRQLQSEESILKKLSSHGDDVFLVDRSPVENLHGTSVRQFLSKNSSNFHKSNNRTVGNNKNSNHKNKNVQNGNIQNGNDENCRNENNQKGNGSNDIGGYEEESDYQHLKDDNALLYSYDEQYGEQQQNQQQQSSNEQYRQMPYQRNLPNHKNDNNDDNNYKNNDSNINENDNSRFNNNSNGLNYDRNNDHYNNNDNNISNDKDNHNNNRNNKNRNINHNDNYCNDNNDNNNNNKYNNDFNDKNADNNNKNNDDSNNSNLPLNNIDLEMEKTNKILVTDDYMECELKGQRDDGFLDPRSEVSTALAAIEGLWHDQLIGKK